MRTLLKLALGRGPRSGRCGRSCPSADGRSTRAGGQRRTPGPSPREAGRSCARGWPRPRRAARTRAGVRAPTAGPRDRRPAEGHSDADRRGGGPPPRRAAAGLSGYSVAGRSAGRLPRRRPRQRPALALHRSPDAPALQVVVHEPHGLHEGVDGGRAHEPQAAAPEIPGERGRLRGLRHRPPAWPSPGGAAAPRAPARTARRRRRASRAPRRARGRDARSGRWPRSSRGVARCRRRRGGASRPGRQSGRPSRSRTRRRRAGRPARLRRMVIQESPAWNPSRLSFSKSRTSVGDGAAPLLVVVADVLRGGEPPVAAELPVGAGVEPIARGGHVPLSRAARRAAPDDMRTPCRSDDRTRTDGRQHGATAAPGGAPVRGLRHCPRRRWRGWSRRRRWARARSRTGGELQNRGRSG